MIVRYFKDTDTAVLEFAARAVEETRAVSDDVVIDLDAAGNIVSMTIEHAAERASLPQIQLEEVGASAV